MANRVIKLNSNESGTSSDKSDVLEVYRDVSMVADRKTTRFVEKGGDGSMKVVPRQTFAVSRDVNVKAVLNSLANIFTWKRGERILNPDFGSRLQLYLYEGLTDANREQIAAEVRGICLKWEPRVNVVRVTPVRDVSIDEDNTVQLDIVFTIPSLSDKQYQYSYIYDRTS